MWSLVGTVPGLRQSGHARRSVPVLRVPHAGAPGRLDAELANRPAIRRAPRVTRRSGRGRATTRFPWAPRLRPGVN